MTLTITIASVPDRDCLVAEMWCENEMFAEVSEDVDGILYAEVYPKPGTKLWKIRYSELVELLSSCEDMLYERRR
jgi:hypothetical protein